MPNGETFLAAFLGMEVCSENSRGAGEVGPVPSSSAFPTFLHSSLKCHLSHHGLHGQVLVMLVRRKQVTLG